MTELQETTVMRLNTPGVPADLASSAAQRLCATGLVLAVVIIFYFGVWIQGQVHLNHDVGWIVHSARWILSGRAFGSDIVDPNPPLIWFVSLPAAAIVNAGWLAEPQAIRLHFWFLCLASLALCHCVVAPLREAGKRWHAVALILGIAVACALVSARSFGQREFLAFILGMPYCLLIAGRMEYGTKYASPAAIGSGLLAGIAFGLKPWLLAVPVLLEFIYWIRSGSWRQAFRPETITLGGFLFVYVLVAVFLTPDYFTVTLPLVRAVYWLYGHSSARALWGPLGEALQPAAAGIVMLVISRSLSSYARVLLAAVVGYAFNYWMQHKGFGYHVYPVLATSIVLLLYSSVTAFGAIVAMKFRMRASIKHAAAATVWLLVVAQLWEPARQAQSWFDQNNIETGTLGQYRQALIARVSELAQGGHKKIYTFSTHPYPNFPTTSYVEAESPGRQLAQFAVSAHLKRDWVKDPVALARLDWGVARQREMVVDEFLANDPDIVLINSVPSHGEVVFDLIAFFDVDPRFGDRWRAYHEVKGSNGIKIFVRN